MSRPPATNSTASATAARPAPAPDAPPRDWFMPAIECNGTVAESLGAVLGELAQRTAFIAALKGCLETQGPGGMRGIDAVTDLSQRIRGLENTLKFRLGILRPERAQAWFRAPAATSTGPFSATLIDEPVFAAYDPWDAERVKRELYALWSQRRARALPFKDESGCLWKTLLQFNADFKRIIELPAPFHDLTLEQLPDVLPPHLDSRALRAFLLNVRNEVMGARERLDACYRQLREACERFWSFQLEHEQRARPFGAQTQQQAPPPPPHQPHHHHQQPSRPSSYNPQADSMREEFKRRRQTTGARLLTGADMDALRFMGFEDVPAPEILRQRYLVLAKQYHPDRHGGNENAFKRLSGAYSHLINRLEISK